MGSEVSRAPMFKMFEKYDFRPTQWGTGHPTMVVRAKMAQADLSTRHHQVLFMKAHFRERWPRQVHQAPPPLTTIKPNFPS